jgi:integrase
MSRETTTKIFQSFRSANGGLSLGWVTATIGRAAFMDGSKSKAALDKQAAIGSWRLHDVRRTVATRMAELGVQPHVIEAVLNHISGHKAGVAGVYNRSSYAAEKRAALELWGKHVQLLIDSEKQGDGQRVVKHPTLGERAAN